jgi:hemolysin D
MMTLIGFVVVALLWACLGHLDIIATAEGRIIPSGKVKVIQPFETSVVKAIDVHDGQHVQAGDMLVELDPTMNAAEAGRINHDLIAAEIDAARLKALENGQDFVSPEGADAASVDTAIHEVGAARAEQQAKLDGLSRQLEQKQAEKDEATATLDKLKAAMPLIQKRRDIRKYLFDNEFGSKLTYLEAQQALAEQSHEMDVQRHKEDESTAAIAALKQQHDEADATFHRTNLDKLAEDEGKIGSLQQDLEKAQQRTTFQSLRAPVDGTVQQLAIHTVGGVVQPAEQLLVVVPDDAKLEIESMIPNRDVGFVHAGDPAEIKVEAFTFTRYGLLHGTVTDLSRDTAPLDDRQAQQNQQQRPGQDEEETRQAHQAGYIAHITLDETSIDTETGPQALGPGMAVTVEIKTGRRRVIDYLLSPLKRYRHEGLRER